MTTASVTSTDGSSSVTTLGSSLVVGTMGDRNLTPIGGAVSPGLDPFSELYPTFDSRCFSKDETGKTQKEAYLKANFLFFQLVESLMKAAAAHQSRMNPSDFTVSSETEKLRKEFPNMSNYHLERAIGTIFESLRSFSTENSSEYPSKFRKMIGPFLEQNNPVVRDIVTTAIASAKVPEKGYKEALEFVVLKNADLVIPIVNSASAVLKNEPHAVFEIFSAAVCLTQDMPIGKEVRDNFKMTIDNPGGVLREARKQERTYTIKYLETSGQISEDDVAKDIVAQLSDFLAKGDTYEAEKLVRSAKSTDQIESIDSIHQREMLIKAAASHGNPAIIVFLIEQKILKHSSDIKRAYISAANADQEKVTEKLLSLLPKEFDWEIQSAMTHMAARLAFKQLGNK